MLFILQVSILSEQLGCTKRSRDETSGSGLMTGTGTSKAKVEVRDICLNISFLT